MYITIFVMASIITIVAATNRTDKILYVDESAIASTEKESVAVTNSNTDKVASSETNSRENDSIAETENTATEQTTEPETTQEQTTEAATEPVSATQIKITADTLKVRAEASQDAEMIGLVDMDDVFDVISQNGEWVEINYNGSTGYISAEFTEIIE
jgi:hypothetical protein